MVDEDVDEDSVRNHKKLEQDIKKKENEIVQLKTRKESEVEQAEELKNRWLPELRTQVHKLNSFFHLLNRSEILFFRCRKFRNA